MADFFERTEALAEMVGDDDLRGEFRVEKVYAAVQHERGWENYLGVYGPKKIKMYHNGGGAKFVEAPLKERYELFFQRLADGTLRGTIRDDMKDAMKDLDDELQVRAPERDGELKRAGSYTVTDDDRIHAYKAPGTTYEDENPGNPPGGVIGLLKKAGKL